MEDYYNLIKPAFTPYEHQKRGVAESVTAFKNHGFHALFMEMGTGKTKTTIDAWMALVALGESNGLVVVAPKAILSVWASEELGKHCTIPYAIYTWDGRTSFKSEREFNDVLFSQRSAVFLVNVESFQTVPSKMRDRIKAFMSARKCLMAVDESSYIKSPDAKRSKNIRAAGQLAKFRTILTGTEITNSPLDLYMQFEFLKPGFWGFKNFFIFRSHYAVLVDSYGAGGRTFKKVVGFQRTNELIDKITPYCTRALKKDCLDLPEKIYIPMYVELSDAQRKAYDSLKKNLATMIEDKILTVPNKVALFTKFRQITGGQVNIDGESEIVDPNPPKLVTMITDLGDTDEQAIIWASFTHEIDAIASALEAAELGKVVKFYGAESQIERDASKEAFQKGEARFIVINPQCGAFGLNFQNAHLQYFYSRSLRPADNWQAEDRTHRSGQKHPCVYKILVARNTVDERIEQLLAAKTDIRGKFQDMTIDDFVRLI